MKNYTITRNLRKSSKDFNNNDLTIINEEENNLLGRKIKKDDKKEQKLDVVIELNNLKENNSKNVSKRRNSNNNNNIPITNNNESLKKELPSLNLCRIQSELFNDIYTDHLRDSSLFHPGIGFQNLGNTCFLNSVLQCILYTRPLKVFLNLSNHSNNCQLKELCFICEYSKLAEQVENNKTAIAPLNIIQNLQNIANHMQLGQQEDAHEFLIYFIGALESSLTKFTTKTSKKFSKVKHNFEENLIQKIFGGSLLSKVVCLNCKTQSSKSDKFIDISLVFKINLANSR